MNPDFIIIFGSYAKGMVREDSDLDIVYFSEKIISDYERLLIAQQLADQLNTVVSPMDQSAKIILFSLAYGGYIDVLCREIFYSFN